MGCEKASDDLSSKETEKFDFFLLRNLAEKLLQKLKHAKDYLYE